MWHGEFMLLPLIKPPDRPVDVMLARHSDAEFLGEALKRFGMQLIRGAGAAGRGKDRGGSHAYQSAIQALREGRAVAMTPMCRRTSTACRPRHRHGGEAVRQADPARRDCHLAPSILTYNLTGLADSTKYYVEIIAYSGTNPGTPSAPQNANHKTRRLYARSAP